MDNYEQYVSECGKLSCYLPKGLDKDTVAKLSKTIYQ
jgi:hypothetical protein